MSKTATGKAAPKKSTEFDRVVVFAEICRRIAKGETLQAICREDGMPAPSRVYAWMEESESFAGDFAQARARGHDAIAAETLVIADEQPPTTAVGGTDAGYVAWQKNRIWTRLQLLSKWDPKRYGDRVDLNHGIQPENPLAKLLAQVQGTPLRPRSEDGEK